MDVVLRHTANKDGCWKSELLCDGDHFPHRTSHSPPIPPVAATAVLLVLKVRIEKIHQRIKKQVFYALPCVSKKNCIFVPPIQFSALWVHTST